MNSPALSHCSNRVVPRRHRRLTIHVLHPYSNNLRATEPDANWWGAWRSDVTRFAVTVPGDKAIAQVALYQRPFVVRSPGDKTLGNINDPAQDITAENFMAGATLLAVKEVE